MKAKVSFYVVLILGLILILYRANYSKLGGKESIKITTWDAYGYYLYLPSTIIYHDLKELKFQDSIDAKYHLSGGKLYQANRHEKTGNYVFKYLGGIAILHLPLFLMAHAYAILTGQDADGFSQPYQNGIGFGVVLYAILALFILRVVLLKYFDDTITAITLFLLIVATNSIQYISIDSAQSHAPIFLLYSILLYLTVKWHENPNNLIAFLAGFVMGLATISRPTEAIIILIPILWNTHTKEMAKQKWELVRANIPMIYLAALGGILGVLPQLIYWQYVTGFFVYDVGSAWRFLSPFFRVLFGFEKGWFIYTPITIFFVVGLFFMKNFPFKKSVIWFCAINIWIIISWSDWKYGGSYSTRALMQSYPVFALAFASFINWVFSNKFKYFFIVLAIYLSFVNFFQLKQYNQTVLHYYDMNRMYYSQIYLNSNPTPLDKSLLDNQHWISNEDDYKKKIIFLNDSIKQWSISAWSNLYINPKPLNITNEKYLRIDTKLALLPSFGNTYIKSVLQKGDSIKIDSIRTFYPGAKQTQKNEYSFYVKVPIFFNNSNLNIQMTNGDSVCITNDLLRVTGFTEK